MTKIYLLCSLLLFGFKTYAQCPSDSQHSFAMQDDIDSFFDNYPSCTSLQGQVDIGKDGSDIGDLDGLINLTSITGQLNIYGTNLTDLTGLDNITTLGGLNIDSNPSLLSLDGLDNLTDAGSIISIVLNGALEDISALEGITWKDYSVMIDGNESLSNCAILPFCNNLSDLTISSFSNNAVGCSSLDDVEEACEAVLPVTLTDFKVKKERSVSLLSWNTAAEVNCSRFVIEHSQTGKSWRTVGTVTATGAGNYSFTDKEPWDGNNYYRLKMMDLDETYAYSRIRSVRFDFDAALYPNPVSDKILIKNTDWNTVQQVRLYNSLGKMVFESKKVESSGIEVSQVLSGIYTVHLIYNNGSMKNYKIIKD